MIIHKEDEYILGIISVICDSCGYEEEMTLEALADNCNWEFTYNEDGKEYHYCKKCSNI